MANQYSKRKIELEGKLLDIESLLKQGYSVNEISKILGYKYAAVYNCINNNGLGHFVSTKNIGKSRTTIGKRRDDDKKNPLNYETLNDLYHIQNKNLYEISNIFNISPSGVLYRMRKFGIKTRKKSEAIALMYNKKPEVREKHRMNANLGLTGVFKSGNNYTFTWIERSFLMYCEDNNIPYKRPFQIVPDGHRYDFLVRDKLIVELDGLYWHNKPKQKEKDTLFEQQAKDGGYDIIRFTDKEIRETKGKCFEAIK